jgi:hypothetical protein
MSDGNRAKDEGIGKTGGLLTNTNAIHAGRATVWLPGNTEETALEQVDGSLRNANLR